MRHGALRLVAGSAIGAILDKLAVGQKLRINDGATPHLIDLLDPLTRTGGGP
jgi:hypothetical protein